MNEDFDTLIGSCQVLYRMVAMDDSPPGDHEDGRQYLYVLPFRTGGSPLQDFWYVGTRETMRADQPDAIWGGTGPTIEAAARDWRSRLVRKLKGTIGRYESYKAWLAEHGMLE